ncbi:MAG: hypothetical protein AB7R63_08505 [Phycisphaerales bacterium]
MTSAGVLSPWLVMPVTIALMGLVALYQAWLARVPMPRWRRRLRAANGWVMLLGLPAIGAGFSLVSPQTSPAWFVAVWAFGLIMVACAVILALTDLAISAALGREARAAMSQLMHNHVDEPNARHDARNGGRPQGQGERAP